MTRKTPVEASMASIRKEIEKRMQSSYDSGYQKGLAAGLKAAHQQIMAAASSPTLPLTEVEVDLSSSISLLCLSNRTFNTLDRQKITTIAELIQFSSTDLLDVWSMGKVGIENIENRLAEVGLRLPERSTYNDREVLTSSSASQESHAKLPVTAGVHELGLRPETKIYLTSYGYYTVEDVIQYLQTMSNQRMHVLCDRLYLNEIKLVMAAHGYDS